MGFVTVREEGDVHYDRALRPRGGRPFDVLTVLVEFLDDGTYTVDVDDVLAALDERIDTDWGDTNLSPYLNTGSDAQDLRSPGALNKVKAVGNESRRPLQLDGRMVRTLAPGHYEYATIDEVRRRKRYLGSADLDGEDLDPRAARLYAMLRDHTSHEDDEADPEVAITFRKFGSPDDADADWLADYPYDSLLLLGNFSKQFAEFAVLADVEYRNLDVDSTDDLEQAFGEELRNYIAAALYDDYDDFTTAASDAERAEHVRNEADTSGIDEPAINARMPFFDSDVDIDEGEKRVRLAALYQRATN